MNIELIESKYADLKRTFEEGQLSAEAFQSEVDDLRSQDAHGRYWMIGAESGAWYYYDGAEWTQADPHNADTLPFVDEEGKYWMLGKETNEWYYYDGERWIKPETEPAVQQTAPSVAAGADPQTQYYQDDQGRYWAKGAKSGQWYYYDESGWHRGDDLQPAAPQPATYPPSQPGPAQPAPQPAPAYTAPYQPVQPIQPAPSYLQASAPQPMPGVTQAVTPQPAPQPQHPAMGAAVAGAAGAAAVAYTAVQQQPVQQQPVQPVQQQPVQPVQQQPVQPVQLQPVQPVQQQPVQPVQQQPVQPQPAVQPQAQFQPAEQSMPPQEPGAWYYFDGEQWLKYQEDPNAQAASAENAPAAEVDEEDEVITEDEALIEEDEYEDEDEFSDEDHIIDIEDIDDFVEVVEVSAEDIIDVDEELVDAEFKVEILTPEEERAAMTRPVAASVEAAAVQPQPGPDTAPTPRQAPAAVSQPAAASARQRTGAMPRTVAKPQKAPKGSVIKAIPSWIWTSLGGGIALLAAAFLIIGALYVYNNQEQAAALVGVSTPTSTLPAAAVQTTPTSGPTPTATPTVAPTATPIPLSNFSSNYFGFSMDYPSGWVNKEDDDLVIFAPSARALDRKTFSGGSVRISLADDANLTDLLAKGLEKISPISETLNEGVMDIGEQSWASAQVRFNSDSLGGEAIALIASTVVNNKGYTLMAVAPATEWDDYKPLFQYALESFKFTSTSAVTAPGAADEGTPVAAQSPSPTPTATLPPTVETPDTYIVKSGDTLERIANLFDVSVDDLVKANGMKGRDDIIRVDQELIIPQPGQAVAAATPTRKATATPKPKATPKATSKATAKPTETVSAADSTAEAEASATPAPTKKPTTAPTPAPTNTPEAEDIPLSGRIAYPAYSTDINSFDIWSANPDGSDPLMLAGNASQPHFSRDGSLLAYRSWTPNNRGIFFVDYVGGRSGLLTSFIEDALPAWYKDGSLVFTSRREGDRVPRLFHVDQSGNDYSLGFISEYVDTLANDKLVARGCTVSGDCGLWILAPDGSGEVKISSDASDTAPAAHPQGGRIALMSYNRGGANNWEIWTINEDGSDPQRLTENPANDGLPAWSPDGKSIAFVSDRGGAWNIWAMNADGSNQRKLFSMQGPPDGVVLHDEPNSKGWLEERITWAP